MAQGVKFLMTCGQYKSMFEIADKYLASFPEQQEAKGTFQWSEEDRLVALDLFKCLPLRNSSSTSWAFKLKQILANLIAQPDDALFTLMGKQCVQGMVSSTLYMRIKFLFRK
jgi:hypothetical protein